MYIGEFASSYIRVWFFPVGSGGKAKRRAWLMNLFQRSAVPKSLSTTAGSIDTSTLGTPVAEYDASACDLASYFGRKFIFSFGYYFKCLV